MDSLQGELHIVDSGMEGPPISAYSPQAQTPKRPESFRRDAVSTPSPIVNRYSDKFDEDGHGILPKLVPDLL